MTTKPEDNPFTIDPDRLDVEWQRQPGLMRGAGRREADARHTHSQAKAQLAVCAARLRVAVRKDPSRFGLRDKPTVEEVEGVILIQQEYQKAEDLVFLTKKHLDYAAADVTAFVDRRKALENYVELLALDYLSERDPKPHTGAGRDTLEERRRRQALGGSDDD